ncbi:MAG: secretin N-terminal domain-containing protein [Candidatus Zixiibacteriota bacterium]
MATLRYNSPAVLLIVTGLMVGFMASAIAQEQADPTEPIKTVQFQSADIKSVLTFLADYGGVNVVIAPEVKGTVTIKLSDVHWRTAMDIIGRTYNLAVVDEEEGYIRVLPAEQHRKEVTELEKHKLEQRQLTALETKIVKISNSTSDDIVKAVQSLLTDRGVATSDPRSNSIIIQEVPENMGKVLEFIAELDKPARQIKISAQLLEIWSTDLEEIGINWDVRGTPATEPPPAGHDHQYPMTGEVAADRSSDVVGRFTVTTLNTGGWSANAIVEAIVNARYGKIIAHPEITTIDNKEAKIQMGQKIPVKQFDEAGNVVIRFEEVGTILNVTPHITAENQILMDLRPERSTYEFDPNGVIINTSNAATNVIVNSGQTAVIGGLTTEDEVEAETGVPLLKDIPLLGRLFKFTTKRLESRDLVIFVTPTIVDQDLAQGG